MQINGYALTNKSDGSQIGRWPEVPGRIDLPNGNTLMGADAGWTDDTYEIVPVTWTEDDQVPARRLVAKAEMVDRLYAAGKLDAARAALDAADLYTRERWNSRDSIHSDDPTALALLEAIGADPLVIMAP